MKSFILSVAILAGTSVYSQENSQQTPFGEPAKDDWDLRCFPNPTSDMLIIKSSKEVKSVDFYDINGKEIKPSSLPNDCYSLSDIPSGWVFVLVQSADGFYQRKSVYKN